MDDARSTIDKVYEDNGYMIQDKDATSIKDVKEKERVMTEAIEESAEEMGITSVVVKSEEKLKNGENIELPLRVSYAESKVKLSRLPVWFLNALGSLSISELDDFVARYKNELSVNERLAINLLNNAMAEDKDALNTFWQIQQKMLQKTNVANQINIAVTNKDSSVSKMLDDIASKIKDADVAAGN